MKDRSVPRTLRLRVWLLLGYLALPIDLVPDFIPVVGYAKNGILTYFVLRRVVLVAGEDVVARFPRHTRGAPHPPRHRSCESGARDVIHVPVSPRMGD